jgi:hypothetical protein
VVNKTDKSRPKKIDGYSQPHPAENLIEADSSMDSHGLWSWLFYAKMPVDDIVCNIKTLRDPDFYTLDKKNPITSGNTKQLRKNAHKTALRVVQPKVYLE